VADILDRAHFDHMTGGDRALQAEIVRLFRAQAESWRNACASGDWRAAVHTIKGSARGIGLMALAHACVAAENAPPEAITLALSDVRASLAAALKALETDPA
jgi:HPt (histidine-containing phosphotransfer) domain-containing protein